MSFICLQQIMTLKGATHSLLGKTAVHGSQDLAVLFEWRPQMTLKQAFILWYFYHSQSQKCIELKYTMHPIYTQFEVFYFKSSPDKLGGTFSQVTWVRYAGFFWFPRFPSMPIYTFGPWFPEGLSLFLLKLWYPCISQFYYIYTVLSAIQTYK